MKIELAKTEIIHFIGIGGIGMSGLSLIMKAKGFTIQGSDLSFNKNIYSNYDSLESIMFSNQPAIIQADQTICLMKENISAVRSEFFPKIFINGTYQSINDYDDSEFLIDEFSFT